MSQTAMNDARERFVDALRSKDDAQIVAGLRFVVFVFESSLTGVVQDIPARNEQTALILDKLKQMPKRLLEVIQVPDHLTFSVNENPKAVLHSYRVAWNQLDWSDHTILHSLLNSFRAPVVVLHSSSELLQDFVPADDKPLLVELNEMIGIFRSIHQLGMEYIKGSA